MANYCEGILRVRGSYKNLKRFIDETFDDVKLVEEKIADFENIKSAHKLEHMKMRMYAKENYDGEELGLLLFEINEEEKKMKNGLVLFLAFSIMKSKMLQDMQ